ncbi:hypothetical protein WA026_000466 [Henosepilachna vigintioctopunctata]|uniref:Major facilitator superfamily (MFS) profile domain-containing protein n=1 Tax=Henosepilachna vigintioctopunctata TaxID=420089 RepID=A0AAW1V7C0_9CUCU
MLVKFPKQISEGSLGCFMGVFSSVGYLMVYLLGPFVSVKTFSFILMVPIVMFLVLFSLWLQESPYYHIANSDPTAAEMSLSKLRTKDSNTIHKELEIIRETIEECKSDESFIGKLKCKSFRKGIIITVTMMVFQPFMGLTIILSYMQPIFAASGSSLPSSTSTILVSFVQLISVLVSSSLVEKWGRRKLLMLATSGCTLPLFMLGVFFYLKNEGKDVSFLWWLPVCSLIAYMVAYSSGLGSVIWALVGELFSTKTKALASSLTAFTCFFLSFFVTLIFPSLEGLIGYHGTFWFFSCNGLIFCLFVFFFVPETKGKSFQEIKILLEQ